MPKAVFKYPLHIIDLQELELPIGAEILDVQMQRDQLVFRAFEVLK